MNELPSKTVRIRKEYLDIIEDSLPQLERKFGDAVNYVLKKGIESLGLKKSNLELALERREHSRPKKNRTGTDG